MKTLLLIATLTALAHSQTFTSDVLHMVVVTDTAITVIWKKVTMDGGGGFIYIGDKYIVDKGKIAKETMDTATVTPAVYTPETLTWKKIHPAIK